MNDTLQTDNLSNENGNPVLRIPRVRRSICIPFFDYKIDRNKQAKPATLFDLPPMGIGFSHVVNSIDKTQFTVNFDVFENINKYDYCLISLVSYYDYFNLYSIIKDFDVRTNIIIGGPAVLNIYPFIDKIYAACFGRCDTQINDILNGMPCENVYSAEFGINKYSIGQATTRIGDYREHENAVGCKKKCFFCEYGFKYKFVDFAGQYCEYANNETFFKDIDFINHGSNTAGLDGLTEKERWVVNKPLTNNAIIEKLNTHIKRDNFRLKLFTVCGYPFTDGYYYEELIETVSKAKTKPVTIMLGLSHFCPMPLTPMEEEKVLITDLKRLSPIKVNNIKMMTYLQSTSYKKAVLNALFNRMRENDIDTLKSIFCLNIDKLIPKIMSTMPHIVDGGYIPVEYIERTFKIDGMKKLYKRRKSEYCA